MWSCRLLRGDFDSALSQIGSHDSFEQKSDKIKFIFKKVTLSALLN